MTDDNCFGCGKKGVDLNPDVIKKLVDEIPISPGLKADDTVLAERLAVCLVCDAVREGVLCAYCGCFVRFRIRSRKAYCPHPAGEKWPTV